MNYEIVNMTDAEKLANYDKLVLENKQLESQRNYYKQEYDYNNVVREKNKQIRKLQVKLAEANYGKSNNNL